jgi:hypothetical protein
VGSAGSRLASKGLTQAARCVGPTSRSGGRCSQAELANRQRGAKLQALLVWPTPGTVPSIVLNHCAPAAIRGREASRPRG